jgi:hypothetical protein
MNAQFFKTSLLLLLSVVGLAGCLAQDAESDATEDTATSEENLSAAYMSCYIDTPALDVYQVNDCWATGTSNTVVRFKLTTSTPPNSVVWYNHPECTGSVCVIPIKPNRVISQAAYYIVNGIPTLGAGATARYELPY